MRKKKTLEQEINEFFEEFDPSQQYLLLQHLYDLFHIYDIDEKGNLTGIVAKDDERAVRVCRIVYLLSRIAEFHAAKLITCKIKYKDLWRRMEQIDVSTYQRCDSDAAG